MNVVKGLSADIFVHDMIITDLIIENKALYDQDIRISPWFKSSLVDYAA